MPEVSIIVAAYNGEKFIKKTIESLLFQKFSDLEVIVVDDGSTDSTAGIIKSFKDERIKYFYKENSGNQAIPRNYGVKKAQGEYIALCDQDDIWYSDKLEKQISIKKDSKIGIIASSADIINERGGKIGARYISEGFLNSKESFIALINENFITTCSVLIPKKILDDVGLFNEKLSGNDDYDLWLRIAKKYGIYCISELLCAWRRSEKAFSRDMSRVLEENQKIFNLMKVDNKKQREIISEGKNKNLLRLFLAYVKEGKYDKAKKVLSRIESFTGMMKFKIFIKVFRLSPTLSSFLARANLVAKKRL